VIDRTIAKANPAQSNGAITTSVPFSPEEAHPFSLRGQQGAWRDALLRRMLATADLLAVFAGSLSVGLAIEGRLSFVVWSAGFVPMWLVIAKVVGLYDRDQRSLRHLTVDEVPSILTWSLIGTAGLALLLAVAPASDLSAGTAMRLAVVVGISAFLLRAIARIVWRRMTPPDRVSIVGEGALVLAASRKLELFPDMHAVVVDERSEVLLEDLRGSPDYLRGVDRILLATSSLDEELIAELVAFCRRRQVKLSVVPPARGMFGTAVELNHVADLPVMEYNTWDVSRSTVFLKRLLDVTISSIVLVLLSPILLLISVLILLDGGRPVVFAQHRVGQNGKPFRMLKFRTMVQNAEALLPQLVAFDELSPPMFKLAPDPRVTHIGRVLRRTSLDELPQLVNVLRGDMSLVGPRPEQVELVERYAEQDRFRLIVKPGMTGPMQVYGRGNLTFEERLAVEREYVENISIGRDFRILAMTVAPVVSGRGAF